MDFEDYADDFYQWADTTFGPGRRTAGIVQHIRKELLEIEQTPGDPEEWVDVITLGINGAMRLGLTGAEVLNLLQKKLKKNKARSWPDWRTAPPDQAIEHDRSRD